MPHYSLLIGPKAHSRKLRLNNWLSWPRFRTEAATLQRTKRIMSSTFSTERPKATGCHRAEWSQCNEKSVITLLGLIVQVFCGLQFTHVITHLSNHDFVALQTSPLGEQFQRSQVEPCSVLPAPRTLVAWPIAFSDIHSPRWQVQACCSAEVSCRTHVLFLPGDVHLWYVDGCHFDFAYPLMSSSWWSWFLIWNSYTQKRCQEVIVKSNWCKTMFNRILMLNLWAKTK